jgi:hypothetical protein
MGTTNLDSLELGGDLTVTGDLSVTGDQTVTGDITYAGDVTLGDDSSDTVTVNGALTVVAGINETAQSRTPAADDGPNTIINPGVTAVDVGAVTTDANDWITLPSLSSVQVGHTIKIACNAGSNFELRTPGSSNEKINNVDADGTNEYLCTDTDTIIIWKLSDTDGWVAQSITNLGAVRTAVIPD